jgi:hypothetical protein
LFDVAGGAVEPVSVFAFWRSSVEEARAAAAEVEADRDGLSDVPVPAQKPWWAAGFEKADAAFERTDRALAAVQWWTAPKEEKRAVRLREHRARDAQRRAEKRKERGW